MNEYYIFLNYSPIHLLEMIYDEASCSENYYLSPVNVLRCDVSQKLRSELARIVNVPFTCCGFLKTPPLTSYPLHTDKYRIAAINMPLFDNTPGFNSYNLIKTKLETINYQKNYFTMLNVTKPHGVSNKNLSEERIMLSIGIKNHSYNSLKDMHDRMELLNVVI